MCDPVIGSIVSAVAGVAKGVSDMQAAKKADKRANRAADEAKQNSERALREQDQITSRKSPNIAALLAANTKAAKSPTLLSGTSGVSASQLSLGQNKVLGN